MELYQSPQDLLYHLETTSPQESRKLWKQSIKSHWKECAYCGNENHLTLDHITPQAKGGHDTLTNVICACESCNKNKAHEEWQTWYHKQQFFNLDREQKILHWIQNGN